MPKYIDADEFVKKNREWYCEQCEKRKGMKRGKLQFVYEIGDAPCRACDVDDVISDIEDFPAADVVPVVRCKDCKYKPTAPDGITYGLQVEFRINGPTGVLAYAKTDVIHGFRLMISSVHTARRGRKRMGQYDFRTIMTRRAEWKGDVLQVHDTIRDVVNGLEQEIESAVLNHFDMDFTDLREYLRDKEEWKRKQAEAISHNTYTAHEVAVILAEATGDDCACDVHGNDEWLPEFCEFSQTVCPDPAGVACWEQWLKWRGKRKENK